MTRPPSRNALAIRSEEVYCFLEDVDDSPLAKAAYRSQALERIINYLHHNGPDLETNEREALINAYRRFSAERRKLEIRHYQQDKATDFIAAAEHRYEKAELRLTIFELDLRLSKAKRKQAAVAPWNLIGWMYWDHTINLIDRDREGYVLAIYNVPESVGKAVV